jgi:hypothetical protein
MKQYNARITTCLFEVVARNQRLGPLGINNVAY